MKISNPKNWYRRWLPSLKQRKCKTGTPDELKGISGSRSEASFTIIETLAALAILLPVVIETVSTQGSIINNHTYMRRVTEATWLAKRLMSQVEYNYSVHPFKEMDIETSDGKFDIKDPSGDFDYTYKISIQEWKLPLFELLMQGGPKSSEDGDDQSDSSGDGGPFGGFPGVDQVIKSIFEDHVLKIANVEVFWPEGAIKDSVSLTLLLTNQKSLDTFLLSKKKVMKELLTDISKQIKGKNKSDDPQSKPPPPGDEENDE